ncbi:hypothetical protein, partial [Parachitinimonas caeni]
MVNIVSGQGAGLRDASLLQTSGQQDVGTDAGGQPTYTATPLQIRHDDELLLGQELPTVGTYDRQGRMSGEPGAVVEGLVPRLRWEGETVYRHDEAGHDTGFGWDA